MIDAEALRQRLRYDPATGDFFWIRGRGRLPGEIAGCITLGYRVIKIDRERYKAHRLAWLYMTGSWPTGQIDHINRRKGDNSWSNLRAATQSQNNANGGTSRANTSGYRGVRLITGEGRRRPWRAQITVDHDPIHLGYFATAEEARTAYCEAAARLFGNFAPA